MIQSSHWKPLVNLARTKDLRETENQENINIVMAVATRAPPLLSVGAFGSWAAMIDDVYQAPREIRLSRETNKEGKKRTERTKKFKKDAYGTRPYV